MKIKMQVSNKFDSWDEEYNLPEVTTIKEAKKWAEKTIKSFNDGLRPGESPRTLVSVEEMNGGSVPVSHHWEKTNLVTVVRNGLLYDTVRCARCGITGKRFGLNGVTIDKKYRAKKYQSCKE
jgi:hypothetical protein